MGIESAQEFLAMVASIITSLGILWIPYKKVYLDPREELRLAKEELEAKKAEDERERIIAVRRKEHKETMAKMEETSAPHIELLKQHNDRIKDLEGQNVEHEGRILFLEKKNGVKTFGFVEKEGE